jgi:hypothetical protein
MEKRMKNVVIFATIIAATLALTSCASMEQISEADKTFAAIYEAPSAPKDKIYTLSKTWIAENFRSAQRVIDLENKDEGLIIAKGAIAYPCDGVECVAKGKWIVSFTMRMDIKDDRFRLTFSNLAISMPQEVPMRMRGDLESIRPRLLAFGPDLQAAISNGKARKDW